ncbi:hypothetical protein DPEC_G00303180 [Dallia pectoralis]|uniref:Uncharacterized protein n=1 Tax=Dallia pectoralis TaxID=75939 RepID=A0ACC2FD67_DALPE|nr:hypothetical protein DPEC_G00303180 [Dallia pectoralis]
MFSVGFHLFLLVTLTAFYVFAKQLRIQAIDPAGQHLSRVHNLPSDMVVLYMKHAKHRYIARELALLRASRPHPPMVSHIDEVDDAAVEEGIRKEIQGHSSQPHAVKVMSAAGPSAAGPSAAGPSAAGPSAAGPSAGPSAAGPSAAGPSAAGPSAAGPSAAGPSASSSTRGTPNRPGSGFMSPSASSEDSIPRLQELQNIGGRAEGRQRPAGNRD